MEDSTYGDFLAASGGDAKPIHFKLTKLQREHLKASLKQHGTPIADSKINNESKGEEPHINNGQDSPTTSDDIGDFVKEASDIPFEKLPIRDYILPTDMARTKTYNSSANLNNISQMLTTRKIPSNFSIIRHQEYTSPGDRIARLYTPSAAGLTMPAATSIAKSLMTQPPGKVVGFVLSATAPDAFEATNRINEVATSPTGKMPTKTRKVEEQVVLPVTHSPLAVRDQHRLNRSSAGYDMLPPSPRRKEDIKPFMNEWDPLPLDDDASDNNISSCHVKID